MKAAHARPKDRMILRAAVRVSLCTVLLPAMVLTVLRLTQPEAGSAVRVIAFTPYALVAYALAAGLAALLVGIGRRAVHDLVLAGVVVLGLVIHTVWVWPLLFGDAPEAAGSERVHVMTLNAEFGEADPEAVVDAVRSADVQLLAVSEITAELLAGLERAGIDEVLPERAGSPEPDVDGTMAFSREPIEVLARLDTRFGGFVASTLGLTAVVAHPVAPVDPAGWRRDHEQVLDAAREHDADVVLGDLNATLDHAPLHDLEDAGYRDAVELTNGGFQPTWPAHGEYPPFSGPVVAIDHVLVRAPWTVTDVHTVDVPATDHRGVVATLAPAAE